MRAASIFNRIILKDSVKHAINLCKPLGHAGCPRLSLQKSVLLFTLLASALALPHVNVQRRGKRKHYSFTDWENSAADNGPKICRNFNDFYLVSSFPLLCLYAHRRVAHRCVIQDCAIRPSRDHCKSWYPGPNKPEDFGPGEVLKRDDVTLPSSASGPPTISPPSVIASKDEAGKHQLERRIDERNQIPQWVMCSYPDGRGPTVINRAQIINAIAAGMQRYQDNNQTPRWGPNNRQYPAFFRNMLNLPLLNANPK